jgi:transcription initiation factor IIE alpha subunit
MNCEYCGSVLQEAEANRIHGKILCEDCYFNLIDPPKVCDPLAVSSTQSLRKQLEQTGTDGLTELQKQIYTIVIEKGKISREELAKIANISVQDLERQFVVLRHCLLLRAFKENNTIYLTKYSQK